MKPFNQAPYGNLFDESKGDQQILFRPEFPIQGKELNEVQSLLSNQIAKFGRHVFKNGSPVLGGQLVYKQSLYYVKLKNTFLSLPIDVSLFLNQEIIEKDSFGDETGVIGRVVHVEALDGDDPNTLYIEFTGSRAFFTEGNDLFVSGTTIGCSIADTDAFGYANFLAVNEGTFFIDDMFVDVPAKQIVLLKYSTLATGKVGFTYTYEVITEEDDESLYDNAQGTEAEHAPGAHRLRVNCELEFYDSTIEPPSNFIAFMDVNRGSAKSQVMNTEYNELAKEFARRTYDESGNYTVRPYSLNLDKDSENFIVSITRSGTTATVRTAYPHELSAGDEIAIDDVEGDNAALYNGSFTVGSVLDSITFTYTMAGTPSANAVGENITFERKKMFAAILGPGKSYIMGYERENIANLGISIPRARETLDVNNYNVSAIYGNYVIVKNLEGFFDPTTLTSVNLYTTNNGSGSSIGTAKIRFIKYHSGTYGTSNLRFRLYLYDFNFTDTVSFAEVRSIKYVPTNALAVVAEESIQASAARLFATNSTSLLFPIPQSNVKTLKPIGNESLSYVAFKKFEAIASGNNATFSVSGNSYFVGPSGSNFADSDSAKAYIAINNTSGNPLTISSIVLSNSNQTLTITIDETGADIKLIAPVQDLQKPAKTKTLTTVNVNIDGGIISQASPRFVLPYADAFKILKVYESSSPSINATTSDPDVTSNYSLFSGQKDTHYDYGEVILNPGAANPKGRLLVQLQYFAHSGTGYFSVDSYTGIDWDKIPTYVSETGMIYRLSDVIDFRPRRSSASNHSDNLLPADNSVISSDYSFYIPRRDLICVFPDGSFNVVKGKSALNPMKPTTPRDGMVLYELWVPAYTSNPSRDIQAKFIDNKRYTMRDIGVLDKRITRLEYYTTLTLLELEAHRKPILDENGFDRFKSGILVDNFRSYGTSDVASADFKASLDLVKGELRPPFVTTNARMKYLSGTNIAHIDNPDLGEFVTLPWTNEVFQRNLFASKAQSVNPYLVITNIGTLECNPPSDDWKSVTSAPDILVNNDDAASNWVSATEPVVPNQQNLTNFDPTRDALANAISIARGEGTNWQSWQNNWTGVATNTTNTNTQTSQVLTTNPDGSVTTTTTTRTANTQEQPDLQVSLGENLIDANIIHFMRAVNISFVGRRMRPNRDIHVFFDGVKVNNLVTPTSGFVPSSEGSVRTDANGEVRGTIAIPANRFRTGQRLIILTDESNANLSNATTFSKFEFNASGFELTQRETILSVRQPPLVTWDTSTNVSTTPPAPNEPWLDPNWGVPIVDWESLQNDFDPFAQTFSIPANLYPSGLFVSSITLYFRQKGAAPIELHMRPTVNGFPSSKMKIPLSTVTLNANQVSVPANTNDMTSIRNAGTTFTFPVPIYLKPGEEYAFVTITSDPEYELYISEMGEKVLGTEDIISQQGVLGSLFKSQNASTWSPYQKEDLMFSIDKAVWNPAVSGVAVFDNAYDDYSKRANILHYTNSAITLPPVADISYEYQVKTLATNSLDAYKPLAYHQDIYLENEKIVDSNAALKVRSTLTTQSRDVAPLIDLARNSCILVQNIINNFGLVKEGFVIEDGGENYTSTPVISISGFGSGATATAVLFDGSISDIVLTNPGQNYYNGPVTITVSGGGGSGAVITYDMFENKARRGNALARYISHPMTLKDEFETDFITVYTDVYIPSGTEVRVYYKSKSVDDQASFESRPWIEMKRKNNSVVVSGSEDDLRELEWVPVGSDISYIDDGITYDKSKIISIKIVMLSNNTSIVPRIKDMRLITTVN